MTTGTLFPVIEPEAVRKIKAPVLILGGARSRPFLELITQELGRLLPHSQAIVFPNAGHQMCYQEPEAWRREVEKFLAEHGIH